MIYLYVLFELSSAGSVYKWRIPQPDLATCLKVVKETKAETKGELGVVVTCGGEKIEKFYSISWSK